jgi:hydrogenase 3 maturation protease
VISDSPLEAIKALLKSSKNYTLICIGNELRGDDQVGIYLGDKLKRSGLRDKVIIAYSSPENYIDDVLKRNPDLVFFLDAVQASQKPGTIIVQELKSGESLGISVSTHSIPIDLVVAVMRSTAPKMRFFIVGVQIEQVELGKKMSRVVTEAAKVLIEAFKIAAP